MSLKGSTTQCDYLDFDYVSGVASRLRKNPKTKLISDYITISSNTGLRSSDVLKLTWEDLRKDKLPITETKTKKKKVVRINENIHAIISPEDTGSPFLTRQNTIISIRQVNNLLKVVFADDIKKGLNISSHTLRKTFGRRVYKINKETEASLITLSDIFNHTSIKTTKLYLGIRQEEIDDVYMNL